MNYWNGNPSIRIWVVGTHRVLGVSEQRFADATIRNLPEDLEAKLSSDTDLFGDFTICPFTPDEPGVMRLVCVDSVTHVEVRAKE